MKKLITITIMLLLSYNISFAANTAVENQDRAMEIYHSITCNACDSDNLALDDTKLGIELREIVENKVMAGFSDEEIIKQLILQYGDFISPKNDKINLSLILWVAVIVVAILGIISALYYIKASKRKFAKTNAIFYENEKSGITDVLDSINN